MSSTKFAAITATLLARKGDAAPSVVVPVTPLRPATVSRGDQPFAGGRPPAEKPDKLPRIMVSLTPEELERLCIAAIKTGSNRNDIVRGALSDYFRKLVAEFPQPCPCMEEGAAVAPWYPEAKPRVVPPSYPTYAENLASETVAMASVEDQVAM